MKIAILGSKGQLGQAVCRLGLKRGHDIVSYSREVLDVSDSAKCILELKKIKPDIVINCAAYHVVPECEKNPELAFKINTVAQKELASISKNLGAKIVYISTDKVFDGRMGKPYGEGDKTNPIQMYGLSKLAGEIATLNYNKKSYVIRTNGIYGGTSGSRIKKGNFVLYILNQAKNKRDLEISSDQYANFVYADDLAQAIFDLLDVNADYGIYHLVNDGYESWANFAKEIVKLSKLKLKIIPVDRSGVYSGIPTPTFCVLDISKAKKAGIKISSWRNGLKRYLSYLRQNI
jgi:dTDP-4-dehydrorhamnose reductase